MNGFAPGYCSLSLSPALSSACLKKEDVSRELAVQSLASLEVKLKVFLVPPAAPVPPSVREQRSLGGTPDHEAPLIKPLKFFMFECRNSLQHLFDFQLCFLSCIHPNTHTHTHPAHVWLDSFLSRVMLWPGVSAGC